MGTIGVIQPLEYTQVAEAALRTRHRVVNLDIDQATDQSKPAMSVILLTVQTIDHLQNLMRIRAARPGTPVVVVVDRIEANLTIDIARHGAFECLDLSSVADELADVLERAVSSFEIAEPLRLTAATGLNEFSMVGTSPDMQEVYKAIGRVAYTDSTVLILGETGAGKELAARAIHAYSRRADKPFVTINCAAIPKDLIESTLFGHEEGAFTGARRNRVGKFAQASGATIFLDEIAELPTEAQAKLLRVLQYEEVEPVGSNEVVHVDVRIIAATNCNLTAAVKEGRFRRDLYHRLNVVSIVIPPLRRRRSDIPELVGRFVAQCRETYNIDLPQIMPDALDALMKGSWPGNVRQLKHCVNRSLILSGGLPVTGEDIRAILADDNYRHIPGTLNATPEAAETMLKQLSREYLDGPGREAHHHFLDEVERIIIEEALSCTAGNQTAAARLLGISRTSVQVKMRSLHTETSEI